MTTVSKSPPAGKPLTPNFTFRDYSIFFLAGAICATATHGAATPIDVVKTRVQIDPALAKHSLLQGGRKIVAAEGPRGLLTGFGPTAVGYFVQGGGKFAGYEFWKKKFVDLAGSQEKAVQYRVPIYLGAAAVGEQAGFRGLFSGMGPRIYMTAFLVSGQFAIYGQVKHALHAPPGIEIFKE
ncbi:hypothetical protein FS837_010117 [Tulasnella sp. UAMH 9824]|nr:hypothetical protein FS837_010117 [Tulasnella sp. UAMH 9824]